MRVIVFSLPRPGPNRLWLGDITYLDTDEGWLTQSSISSSTYPVGVDTVAVRRSVM